MKWYRNGLLEDSGEVSNEKWIREANNSSKAFDVQVYLGKKTNLLSLKKNIVETIQKQLEYYKKSRNELYLNSDMDLVTNCPVCKAAVEKSIPAVKIYGAEYHQCGNCTHVYVIKRPSKRSINNFYLNNVTYAATYTDKKSAESRLNAIAMPWVDWMVEVYQMKYGTLPNKVLDVGSGAGHFVEACRRKGLHAEGIELSESSREFSQKIWGIEMDGRDFLEVYDEYKGFDVVTFWGLLEHTPNPGDILSMARKVIDQSNSRGMVISKLPRWNSLSSAIQRINTDSIIRHLDPMGHIMAFTDASAAELYFQNGFIPYSAWYYGMDVYETLMQVGNATGNYDHFTKTGNLQMELQQFIDEVRFSDGLTLVGLPF
jgi:2-polyprenyl-3-methyl-5-hydroxy-6-metoxy-1,4-benzoquinol methylase